MLNESMSIAESLDAKRDCLAAILRDMRRVAVAFSGGIDSTVVAQAAFLALGEHAVAITADSPSVPRAEIAEAQELALRIGIRHRLVRTDEFSDPDYVRNDGSRCYHCKDELYGQIKGLLPQLGVEIVCSGANLDDQGDYRPGLTAAAEHHVRHPLQEARFRKSDVRALAQYWNLPTWDKPASPCLSSRLAPGVQVTIERTARVEHAEAFLKREGLRDVRVRLHEGELARIEFPAEEIVHFVEPAVRERIVAELRRLGFRYVTLDMQGFRSGSLNDLVPLEVRNQFSRREVQ